MWCVALSRLGFCSLQIDALAKLKLRYGATLMPLTYKLRMPYQDQPRRGVQGKGREWGEVATCSSEDQLMSWVAEDSEQ